MQNTVNYLWICMFIHVYVSFRGIFRPLKSISKTYAGDVELFEG